MPNFFAHRMCAAITLDELHGSPAAGIILGNAASYRLGCQGADFMYFRPTQLLRGHSGAVYHARLLHGQPVEKLAAMSRRYLASTVGKKQFDSTFAYVCGFLSHHAVDQKVHPIVNAKTDSFLKHRRIEQDLDAYMCAALGFQPGKSKQYWADMPELVGFAALTQWYNDLFQGLFRKKFSQGSYMRDYRAMRRASAFLNRPKKLVKKSEEGKPMLAPAELRAMSDAAQQGARYAALLIDRMYGELKTRTPDQAVRSMCSLSATSAMNSPLVGLSFFV